MARNMFKNAAQGLADLMRGRGRVGFPPDPGNQGNAPGDPAVQTGSLQYIIPQMFDRWGTAITDVPRIPGWGVDWAQYPLNVEGLSGALGGGSTGRVPQPGQGGSLYYDPETDSYIDLNLLSSKRG